MTSFIPWVGGKRKLVWLISALSPQNYDRFIDVFGGSGTVTMSRTIKPGCMEVYNDFNSNLTNLFCCVKNRTMALMEEIGFLPLNSRDDFNVLYKFFSKEEFTEDYLKEELKLTEKYLDLPDAKAIQQMMQKRAPRGDLRRAADYFKLIRYSYSGGGSSFGGKSCDIRRFFYLLWECSRRLSGVVIENKDFQTLFKQYDRPSAYFYCDPPYFKAEKHYEVEFPEKDHKRLHKVITRCKGYVMVSYNYCDFICDLYKDFYIFYTKRPNSMSLAAGSEYEEAVITNYDPRQHSQQLSMFTAFNAEGGKFELVHEPNSFRYIKK